MARITKLIEILDKLAEAGRPHGGEALGGQFDAITQRAFQVASGLEFVSDYNSLLDQIEEDICAIPKLNERQINIYLSHIRKIRGIFNPASFTRSWSDLLGKITDQNLRDAIDLMEPILDPDRYDFRKKFDKSGVSDELNTLKEVVENSNLPEHIKRIINFDINKILIIIDNESSFKETKIWEQYQKLTANLVASIYDLDSSAREKFKNPLQKLARRIREGLGIGADIVQIADGTDFPNLLT